MKNLIALWLVAVLCCTPFVQAATTLPTLPDMQKTAASHLAGMEKWDYAGWDLFALSVGGTPPVQRAERYYSTVAAMDLSKSTPSDIANMILSLGAYGYDTKKIGGHDLQALLIERLKAMDFTGKTSYHTGYDTVSKVWSPFMALHFLNISGFDKSVLAFQMAKHLSNEAYYSYQDTYPSIESEAMLMVALAPLKGQSLTYGGQTISVSAALDTAASYYKRIADPSGIGFVGTYGQSVEANSWIAHAFYACGISYDKSALINGISKFYDVKSGGFTGYGGVNEYSTQQALYNITGCLLAQQGKFVFDIATSHGTKAFSGGNSGSDTGETAALTSRYATVSVSGSPVQGSLVQLYQNETPIGLLTRLLGSDNVQVHNGYVQGVRQNGVWRKELDQGPKSGWKFAINNIYIPTGGNTVALNNGDVLHWYYTTGVENRDFPAVESLSAAGAAKFAAVFSHINSKLAQETSGEWMLLNKQVAKQPLSQTELQTLTTAVQEQNATFRKVTDTARYALIFNYSGQQPQLCRTLLTNLQNHANMTMQGINGPIFSLIALNAANAPETADTLWTRAKLRDYILSAQNADGGFGLTAASESTADLTAMAICALAPYKAHYAAQLDKAVAYLSGICNADGTFSDKDISNVESTAQVILALSSLGINPATDSRFAPNTKNPIDGLLSFYLSGGSFAHHAGGTADPMATEQATLALYSLQNLGRAVYAPAPYLYDDFGTVATWAQASVKLCHQKGLMIGTGFTFQPNDPITLWQAKAVLNRIFGTISPDGADGVLPITRGDLLKLMEAQGCSDLLYGNGSDLMLDQSLDRQTLATIAARIDARIHP